MRINPQDPGQVRYFQKKAFYVPWLMDAYKEVAPAQVEQYLGSHPTTDKLLVQPPDSQVRLPLRTSEDLGEVQNLTTQKGLATRLEELARQDFRFHATIDGTSAEVGLYGAYNSLTDPAHGLKELTLMRGGLPLVVADAHELEKVHRFYTGSHPLATLECDGYRLFNSQQEPSTAYVQANAAGRAAWIGKADEAWYESADGSFDRQQLQEFETFRAASEELSLAQRAFKLHQGTLEGNPSSDLVPVLAAHPKYAPMCGFAAGLVEGVPQAARIAVLANALPYRTEVAASARAELAAKVLAEAKKPEEYVQVADRAMAALATEAAYADACKLYQNASLGAAGKVSMAAALLAQPELAAPDQSLALADRVKGEDAVEMTRSAMVARGQASVDELFKASRNPRIREVLARLVRKDPEAGTREWAIRTEQEIGQWQYSYQWNADRANLLEVACRQGGGPGAELVSWLKPEGGDGERLTVCRRVLQDQRLESPEDQRRVVAALASSLGQASAESFLQALSKMEGFDSLAGRVRGLSQGCDDQVKLVLARKALANPDAPPGRLALAVEAEVGQGSSAYNHWPSRARQLANAIQLEGLSTQASKLDDVLNDSGKVSFYSQLLREPGSSWLDVANGPLSKRNELDLHQRLATLVAETPEHRPTMEVAVKLAAGAGNSGAAVYRQAYRQPTASPAQLAVGAAGEVSGWSSSYDHFGDLTKVLRKGMAEMGSHPDYAYNLKLYDLLGNPESTNETRLLRHLLEAPIADTPQARQRLATFIANNYANDRCLETAMGLLEGDPATRDTMTSSRGLANPADPVVLRELRKQTLLKPTATGVELAQATHRAVSQLNSSYEHTQALATLLKQALAAAPAERYGRANEMAQSLGENKRPDIYARLLAHPELGNLDQLHDFGAFASQRLPLETTRRLAETVAAQGGTLLTTAQRFDQACEDQLIQRIVYQEAFAHPKDSPTQLAQAVSRQVAQRNDAYNHRSELAKVQLAALDTLKPSHPQTVERAHQLHATYANGRMLDYLLESPDLSSPDKLAAFTRQMANWGASDAALTSLLQDLTPVHQTLPAALSLAAPLEGVVKSELLRATARDPGASVVELALTADANINQRNNSYDYRSAQANLLVAAVKGHQADSVPLLDQLLQGKPSDSDRRLLARTLLEQGDDPKQLGTKLAENLGVGVLQQLMTVSSNPLAQVVATLNQQLQQDSVRQLALREATANPDQSVQEYYQHVMQRIRNRSDSFNHTESQGIVMAAAARSLSGSSEKKWLGELAARLATAKELGLATTVLAEETPPARPSEFLKLGLKLAETDKQNRAAKPILSWLADSTPEQSSLYNTIAQKVAQGSSLAAELKAVTEMIALAEAMNSQKDLSLDMDVEQVTVGDFTLTRQQD